MVRGHASHLPSWSVAIALVMRRYDTSLASWYMLTAQSICGHGAALSLRAIGESREGRCGWGGGYKIEVRTHQGVGDLVLERHSDAALFRAEHNAAYSCVVHQVREYQSQTRSREYVHANKCHFLCTKSLVAGQTTPHPRTRKVRAFRLATFLLAALGLCARQLVPRMFRHRVRAHIRHTPASGLSSARR
jgi:hypothetical protein